MNNQSGVRSSHCEAVLPLLLLSVEVRHVQTVPKQRQTLFPFVSQTYILIQN